jgi:hypothetical protein
MVEEEDKHVEALRVSLQDMMLASTGAERLLGRAQVRDAR